jgi:serine/threonine protein kinase
MLHAQKSGLSHRWGAQIAGALSHLHSNSPKIIYRDLSAANVLLTSSNARTADIKLIDFGLIKVVPDQPPAAQQCMGAPCLLSM